MRRWGDESKPCLIQVSAHRSDNKPEINDSNINYIQVLKEFTRIHRFKLVITSGPIANRGYIVF